MLPPVAAIPFVKQHNQSQLTLYSMEVAADNVKLLLHMPITCTVAELSDIIDIVVTCDGTWSKHSVTGMHVVVRAIAWESRKVIFSLPIPCLMHSCTIPPFLRARFIPEYHRTGMCGDEN